MIKSAVIIMMAMFMLSIQPGAYADNERHQDREELKKDREQIKKDREKLREDKQKLKADREKMREERKAEKEKRREERKAHREERHKRHEERRNQTGGNTESNPSANVSGAPSNPNPGTGVHASGN